MYKVRTSIDKKGRAELLARALVFTHAAVSVHIREIESIYAWDERVDTTMEYEVEALCVDPERVKKIVYEYHTYELPEFIIENVDSTKEIRKWCDDWCK